MAQKSRGGMQKYREVLEGAETHLSKSSTMARQRARIHSGVNGHHGRVSTILSWKKILTVGKGKGLQLVAFLRSKLLFNFRVAKIEHTKFFYMECHNLYIFPYLLRLFQLRSFQNLKLKIKTLSQRIMSQISKLGFVRLKESLFSQYNIKYIRVFSRTVSTYSRNFNCSSMICYQLNFICGYVST